MMTGKFRQYNWRDIQRLIFIDAGLKTEEHQRAMGEMWFEGGFKPPEHELNTCVKVNVFDKDFSTRTEEHCGRDND